MKRAVFGIAVAALLVGFARLVWPTPYRALSVDLSGWSGSFGTDRPIAARENRLTGAVELFFVGHGWVSVDGADHRTAAGPGDSLHELARQHHP